MPRHPENRQVTEGDWLVTDTSLLWPESRGKKRPDFWRLLGEGRAAERAGYRRATCRYLFWKWLVFKATVSFSTRTSGSCHCGLGASLHGGDTRIQVLDFTMLAWGSTRVMQR